MSSPIHPHRYVTSQNKDSELQSSVKAQFKQVYAYLTLLATMHHQHVPKESKKETHPHTTPNLVPTAATVRHNGRLKDPNTPKSNHPNFSNHSPHPDHQPPPLSTSQNPMHGTPRLFHKTGKETKRKTRNLEAFGVSSNHQAHM